MTLNTSLLLIVLFHRRADRAVYQISLCVCVCVGGCVCVCRDHRHGYNIYANHQRWKYRSLAGD